MNYLYRAKASSKGSNGTIEVLFFPKTSLDYPQITINVYVSNLNQKDVQPSIIITLNEAAILKNGKLLSYSPDIDVDEYLNMRAEAIRTANKFETDFKSGIHTPCEMINIIYQTATHGKAIE